MRAEKEMLFSPFCMESREFITNGDVFVHILYSWGSNYILSDMKASEILINKLSLFHDTSVIQKEPQCLPEVAACDGHLLYSFMLLYETHLVNTFG
jgi:hypothetical protein